MQLFSQIKMLWQRFEWTQFYSITYILVALFGTYQIQIIIEQVYKVHESYKPYCVYTIIVTGPRK